MVGFAEAVKRTFFLLDEELKPRDCHPWEVEL